MDSLMDKLVDNEEGIDKDISLIIFGFLSTLRHRVI